MIVVRTVEGNHMRQHREGGRSNQREVDVIAQEVIPEHCRGFAATDIDKSRLFFIAVMVVYVLLVGWALYLRRRARCRWSSDLAGRVCCCTKRSATDLKPISIARRHPHLQD